MKHFMTRLIYQFLLVAALCLAGGLSLVAQAPSVSWGPKLKLRRGYIVKLAAVDDKNCYVERRGVGVFTGYKGSLSIIGANDYAPKAEIDLSIKPNGYDDGRLLGLYVIKDAIYCFTGHPDNKYKKVAVFLSRYDRDTGQPLGPMENLFESTTDVYKDYLLKGHNVMLSPDSSQFLMYYPEIGEPDDPKKVNLMAVGLDGVKIWSKTIIMDHANKYVTLLSCKMDTQGMVYLLCKILKTDDQQVAGKARHFHQLLRYDHRSGKSSETRLDLDGMFVEGINIGVDKELNLWCGGFYKSGPSGQAEGVFCFKIDANKGKVAREELKPIDLPSGISGPWHLKFSSVEILFSPEGNAILVGEQQMEATTPTYETVSGEIKMGNNYLVFGNVEMVSFNTNGEIDWTQTITKWQSTVNDFGIFSGFLLIEREGYFHLLFNEDNSTSVMVSIDHKGKATKTDLFRPKDTKVSITQPSVRMLDPDTYVFLASHWTKFKVAKLAW